MAVRPAVKLTRKQIYDEVWSAAVSGMALKYSIPYSSLRNRSRMQIFRYHLPAIGPRRNSTKKRR